MGRKSLLLFFSVLFAASCAGTPDKGAEKLADDSRIINTLLKLKNGGDITFAAIGGSITQGGCVDGVSSWLKAKAAENGANVNYINAGIGASDSGLGLLRFKDHVLRHNPDLIIIEYSVNDDYYYKPNNNNRTYEGLVRQALKDSSRAVFLLLMHTADQGISGNNKTHVPYTQIGENYKLPVFKWLDYEKSVTDWKNSGLLPDGTHPNPAGNASVSKGITDYLENIWNSLPGNPLTIDTTLPTAKFSDDYENTIYIKWGDPGVSNGAFTQFSAGMLPPNWDDLSSELKGISGFETSGRDNEMEIKFTGKSVYVVSTFRENWAGKPGGNDGTGGRSWVVNSEGTKLSEEITGSGSWWSGPEWFGTFVAGSLDPEKEHTLHVRGSSAGPVNIWGVVVGIEP